MTRLPQRQQAGERPVAREEPVLGQQVEHLHGALHGPVVNGATYYLLLITFYLLLATCNLRLTLRSWRCVRSEKTSWPPDGRRCWCCCSDSCNSASGEP